MDLQRYVDRLREELGAVADSGGEEVRQVAAGLVSSLDSAVRLVVLQAVSDAAAEITREMAPGSVEVRLRGLSPTFVATPAPSADDLAAASAAPAEADAPDLEDGPSTRINLRLPVALKARVEAAASRERLSINTWLVRAAAAALPSSPESGPRVGDGIRHGGQDLTGWVH